MIDNKIIKDFLEKSYYNENNGLINKNTIIDLNKLFNLQLNIHLCEKKNKIPSLFRYNPLDIILEPKIILHSSFKEIEKIIEDRLTDDLCYDEVNFN